MLFKQKIKYIQSLGQKKFRDAEKRFIAEGPKIVRDLLDETPGSVEEIYATGAWMEENKEIINQDRVVIVTPEQLERISLLTTPNKVLAVVRHFEPGEAISVKGQLVLALDTIQDPGNFGTIIRIADWFGVNQIVASIDSADQYNPKVVQATMGSIARVKVFYRDLKEWLAKQEVKKIAADLDGQPVNSVSPVKEAIIIIGNESKGISNELFGMADEKITIPKIGKAESLNAAVAAGIILSHLTP